jgi:predicted aspartyl protease
LDIGDVKVENVPVYIRRFYDDKVPVDGYLGLSVISKFVASIDYGDHSFTLARQQSEGGTPWSTTFRDSNPPRPDDPLLPATFEIPLRTTSSGFLSGEVHLEGVEKPLNFIIDTGATVSVVSEKLAALEELSEHLQPGRMRVFGAAGVAEDVKTLLLPKLMLGAVMREQISAAVLDLEPVNETAGFTQNGILGGNFFRQFRVSFDFQRAVIRLQLLNPSDKPREL